MNIHTSEIEFLKTEVQRLRALVRAQQITIDKLEAQPEQEQDGCPVCGSDVHDRDALDKAEREIERLRAWVKFTPPPQRKPLSDEQVNLFIKALKMELEELARAIEAAHGIKE